MQICPKCDGPMYDGVCEDCGLDIRTSKQKQNEVNCNRSLILHKPRIVSPAILPKRGTRCPGL
jgi:hypothetical protein